MITTANKDTRFEELTMSVREMAKKLGISKDSGYALAHSDGFYPAIFIGRSIIISIPAFFRWLEAGNFRLVDYTRAK